MAKRSLSPRNRLRQRPGLATLAGAALAAGAAYGAKKILDGRRRSNRKRQ